MNEQRKHCDCVLCRTKPVDGEIGPADLPADASCTPPIPCAFEVGDKVLFTNDQGVKFRLTVRGFSSTVFQGRFVYVFRDAWWFPVAPGALKKINASTTAAGKG